MVAQASKYSPASAVPLDRCGVHTGHMPMTGSENKLSTEEVTSAADHNSSVAHWPPRPPAPWTRGQA